MFYEDVFQILNRYEVRYVVAGGVAVVLHGVVRLTVDLDLYVEFSESNLGKFIKALSELGYRPKVPVNAMDFVSASNRRMWKEEKGMRELIDVFVDEYINYDEIDKEKKIISADAIEIPVISIRHLKELKKIAGREQDLKDIQALDTVEGLREAKG